ncbi:response regulator protein [Oceanicaulis alexandrii HTCC2633]|jgi:two-component system response regulator QseB|uniref:response regulator transcription factor n=1 Tax=Oceanicaulis sp. HTCC2633 TaxID=314254 RepID=UPI0000668C0C|nr:response regulator transcription factor [Oceanicaulis sp. HTCC2633]EAP90313.1 response regulator protein [Oceanicaulis alexandrii HTCC2633] [Oceanicaulis sp. HTCC2633]
MRVLIIEDNDRLSLLLAEGLTRRGFSCDVAGSLTSAADHIAVTAYDVLVLDLGLPDGDGVDWLKSLPALHAPVLVLTARASVGERIIGLDAGADDYMVKPADPDEIAARLRALLRRPGAREPARIEVGELTFDPAAREARFKDAPLRLGRREAALLEVLMKRPDAVVPREAIETALYSWDDAVSANALEATASRLRRRLADAGAGGLIHVVRGVGYYLGEVAN